jgi:formate dehydrogenase major subunit
VRNALHRQQANPTRIAPERDDNPFQPSDGEPGAAVFPYALTTYRIAEHHTAGGMSRWTPYLSELAPELFVEVSPELAAERGLTHNDWATIVTERAAVEARVMVTDRMVPLTIDGATIHQVGLPWHWGANGLATGDAANELLPIVMDSNVHISEFKASTCDILPGRRPRGRDRLALVEEYRRRADQAGRGSGDA